MLSIQGALEGEVSGKHALKDWGNLPTSVVVPGGVAFLTSALERPKAAFREVISSGGIAQARTENMWVWHLVNLNTLHGRPRSLAVLLVCTPRVVIYSGWGSY
jgi:hypothetical protein